MQYSDFQAMASSEKITLATLDAARRLMGWSLHSGSVYKLSGFSFQKITSLEDSGTAYTEVSSLGSVIAGTFFLDRETQTLYIQTSTSVDPNTRFIVSRVRLFFANVPVVLPHDLASGFEILWEPLVKSTSEFGVEIDTVNQTSEAIEGSGSLTLTNDGDFWPAHFDKLYFENAACSIYSYHRDLDPSDARLIYSGRVDKKSYTSQAVSFTLKDVIASLRTPIALGTIGDLGLRTGSDIERARQRLILGRVFGLRPVNVDQVVDGYPITGTVSVTYNSATLTGTGSAFLTQLSPDDRIVLDGEEYTIATVTSDTSATLTENFPGVAGLSGVTATIVPEQPKRWMNRVWKIAGHALREPQTTVENGSSITQLYVADPSEIFPGDNIYVGTLGSGDLVLVEDVVGNFVRLSTSLATVPPIGTPVLRPAVQNVRIDDVALTYYQDYTLDASTATLTLRSTAESNSAPIRHLTSSLSFTNGSRTVTGTGLKNSIKPGYMVGVVGNAVFFEVLSVDSDTQLTLRTNATFTANTTGRYKSLIYSEGENVLTLDVLGRTEDGTSTGSLLKTAPSMVKALLGDLNLTSRIDSASFDEAEAIAPMSLGLVFPSEYNSSTVPVYRSVINEINRSVFGSLVQTNTYSLAYNVLRPRKSTAAVKFDESDILGWKFESTGEKIVKTCTVEYRTKEYDYLTGKASKNTETKTSNVANYIVQSTREQTFSSALVDETDARILAERWSFILEHSAGRATIETKLQAMSVEVGDIIEVTHRKFFERLGISQKSRLFLVEAVRKSGSRVNLEVVDLSNAFSRVAAVTTNTASYSSATDQEKLYGGYITDSNGLIANDPNSFGLNLIW